jgi:hypothetical protein
VDRSPSEPLSPHRVKEINMIKSYQLELYYDEIVFMPDENRHELADLGIGNLHSVTYHDTMEEADAYEYAQQADVWHHDLEALSSTLTEVYI